MLQGSYTTYDTTVFYNRILDISAQNKKRGRCLNSHLHAYANFTCCTRKTTAFLPAHHLPCPLYVFVGSCFASIGFGRMSSITAHLSCNNCITQKQSGEITCPWCVTILCLLAVSWLKNICKQNPHVLSKEMFISATVQCNTLLTLAFSFHKHVNN